MTNTKSQAPFKAGSVVDATVSFVVKENTEKKIKPGVVCEVMQTNYTVFVDQLELVATPKLGDRLQVEIINSWTPRHKPSRNPDGLNWLASERKAVQTLQEKELDSFRETAKSLFGTEMAVAVEKDNRCHNDDVWGVWASMTLPEFGKTVRVYMNPRPFDDHNLPIPVGKQMHVIIESQFTTFSGEWVLRAKPVLTKDADGNQVLSILTEEVQG